MKEASGELSMTAVAVVAITAVGGIFMAFVWPSLKGAMISKTNCQSAFNWGACGKADGSNAGTKVCTGYYDKDGKPVTEGVSLSCDCS